MKRFTAFYDLAIGPVSYDFVSWLVRAMKERDARGCAAMHVVIVPNEGGLGGFARHWGEHDAAATRWRFWHIVVPACQLADATLTIAADREQAERLRPVGPYWWPEGAAHHSGPLVEAARRGERIPRLVPSEAARRYVNEWVAVLDRPIVTLTLRQQSTVKDRNSRRSEWAKFAGELRNRYHVIALDDSHVALSVGRGCFAELDVDLRLALYERAAMNLFSDNGPSVLPWFSGAPFMRFCCACSDAGSAEHWAKYLALRPGDQLPWARADQRLVYKPDTLEVLRLEVGRWEAELEGEKWAGATS